MKYSYLLLFVFLFCCSTPEKTNELMKLQGQTMGTYYSVQYYTNSAESFQEKIDSVLVAVNQSLSTYIPSSTISQVNQMQDDSLRIDKHFKTNFSLAKEVYNKTNGAFNPAIMPLVNYWGFGYERLNSEIKTDSAKVGELLQLVNFDSFTIVNNTLVKTIPDAELDFSSLAKGYGVDVIAEFLDTQNIDSYLIDIGGEVRAKGKKQDGVSWKVGIRKPSTDKNERKKVVQKFSLNDEAMATSGNYENYQIMEGETVIAHTINPETGFPQSLEEEIISSTVVANTCMRADAYATAFKVMGLRKSKEVLSEEKDLGVFFIFLNEENEVDTWTNLNL